MALYSFLDREHHPQSLINDILSIMTHILNEEVSQALLDVILRNLVKEGKVSTHGISIIWLHTGIACGNYFALQTCT